MSDLERSAGGWTLDTLEKYLSQKLVAAKEVIDEREDRNRERLAALKASIDVALSAADKALGKAEQATEKRFDSVNEFRQTLQDQAANFLPRGEYNAQYKALLDRIETLSVQLSGSNLQSGMFQSRGEGKGLGIGLVGTLVLGAFICLGVLVSTTTLLISVWRGH